MHRPIPQLDGLLNFKRLQVLTPRHDTSHLVSFLANSFRLRDDQGHQTMISAPKLSVGALLSKMRGAIGGSFLFKHAGRLHSIITCGDRLICYSFDNSYSQPIVMPFVIHVAGPKLGAILDGRSLTVNKFSDLGFVSSNGAFVTIKDSNRKSDGIRILPDDIAVRAKLRKSIIDDLKRVWKICDTATHPLPSVPWFANHRGKLGQEKAQAASEYLAKLHKLLQSALDVISFNANFAPIRVRLYGSNINYDGNWSGLTYKIVSDIAPHSRKTIEDLFDAVVDGLQNPRSPIPPQYLECQQEGLPEVFLDCSCSWNVSTKHFSCHEMMDAIQSVRSFLTNDNGVADIP